MKPKTPQSSDADHFLDITDQVCPMTFVKTKLLIERMAIGETCEVRLKGAEPLENVPRSTRELGHEVISMQPETPGSDGDFSAPHRLLIRKKT
ncbi:MAG: sulfurtransferase TusA family protein [Rhodospirillaceae bacterium]|nr:sulfurtransferase TusA family protein [Rhodospirillaceae bacterium]